jgi:hypothetical protein
VHPHPRDYRSGLFKFISSDTPEGVQRKPRRDDLYRILNQGIDGTSMPSFGLLPEEEKEYLAGYVMHLSIRGETEMQTMTDLISAKGLDKTLMDQAQAKFPDVSRTEHLVHAYAALAVIDWALSDSRPPVRAVVPPEMASSSPEMQASIRKGHELFKGQGICLSCHKDYGRQSDYRFDAWGTNVRPANLTTGAYRGGRRPMDIMNRLKGGIDGSGMPASAVKVYKKDKEGKLTNQIDQEATDLANWDVVNFVRALPYPAMLPRDVREEIYGARKK